MDYLRSRPDVDPSRIALTGNSLGGELVIRAAAIEHRLEAVVADSVAGVAGQVTAPALITGYAADGLVIPASGQGAEVYRLLRGNKRSHQFTRAQGAQGHCAPLAPQTRNQSVYDWLDGDRAHT